MYLLKNCFFIKTQIKKIIKKCLGKTFKSLKKKSLEGMMGMMTH